MTLDESVRCHPTRPVTFQVEKTAHTKSSEGLEPKTVHISCDGRRTPIPIGYQGHCGLVVFLGNG
mgnify:CR=1 FL=1